MKDNLFCREVALLGPTTCWGGCGKEKYINHVFFECDFPVEFDFVFRNGWKFVVCYLLMSLCMLCNLMVHIYLIKSFVITSKWFDRRIFELFERSVILEFFQQSNALGAFTWSCQMFFLGSVWRLIILICFFFFLCVLSNQSTCIGFTTL